MSPNKRKHTEIQSSTASALLSNNCTNNTSKSLKKKCKVSNRTTSCSHTHQQVEQQQQQQQVQPLHPVDTNNKEPSLLNQQALVKFTLGEFDEAESLLKEALTLSNALSNFCQSKKESKDDCSITTDACSICTGTDNSDVTKTTANVSSSGTDNDSSSSSSSETTIGKILKLNHPKQEYDEGMNLFSSPIEISNIWDDTLKSAALQYNLGQTYIKRCNFLVGIDWFRSAMRTCTEINNPSWHHDNVLIVFKIIDAVAYCYYRKELYDDAIKFYEVAEHYASNGKLGYIHVASVKNSLAVVLFRKEASSTQLSQQQTLTKMSDMLTETKRRAISLLNESLTLYKDFCNSSTDSTTTTTSESNTCNRTATVYNNLGRVYYLTGDYQQALSYFESALKIRRKIYNTSSIDLAVTICNLGQTYHQLEQLDEAMEFFNEFLSIAHGSMNDKSESSSSSVQNDSSFVTHRDLSIVVSSVASIHLGRNELNDAKKMYEMALNSSRLAYGSTHAEVAHILNKLGSVCYKLRQFDIALTYLQEGLQIEQIMYGKHHPNVVVTSMNLAQIYRDQNMYEKAFVHYNHAHAAIAATKGSDSIAVSDTLLSMGLMLYRMKAFSSSFDFYQEALYVQRKHYGEDSNHAAVASTLNSIAIVLFHLGQARLAVTYFEESLKMRRQMFGNNHPDIAVNLFNLAKLHLELHDNETASILYKETLKVERAIQGPLSKEVLQTLQLLGLLHQHNGELPIALEYFTEALELERQRCNGTKSVFTAKLLNLIGNIHLQRGNAKDMMKCFVEASYICEGNLHSIAVAGYNFYSLSKLHPECAEVA
jgi:tetratricopeptide (TPR) repeat protein